MAGIREIVISPSFAPAEGMPAFLPTPDSIAGLAQEFWLRPNPASPIAASLAKPLLVPGGRPLRAGESAYLKGLLAFYENRFSQVAENWASGIHRPGDSLEPYVALGKAVLLLMADQPAEAEAVFIARMGQPAVREAAWRNLFSLYLASGKPLKADALMDSILADAPRHPFALAAKAMILRHLRPDSEWEAFIRGRTRLSDSLPDLQIAYGQFLLEHDRLEEAVRYLSAGLESANHRAEGWVALAEAQHRLGYQFFALDCLSNAFRLGGGDARTHELFARVLRACCMDAYGERGERARRSAEGTLEKGLPKDFSRRTMAQLLYHVYAQNGKPVAAKRLREELWFHFQGPAPYRKSLYESAFPERGIDTLRLSIAFGLYSFDYIRAFRYDDQYSAP